MNQYRYYTLYFEIFGKKMKTNILAKNENEAKEKLKNKIIFHKVELDKEDYYNKSMELMDNILNIIK